jgi:hypothetical protein
MFERLKTMMTRLSLAWRYSGILQSLTTAWARYPGLDDPDLLRLWVRPLLLDVTTLTACA